MGGVCLATRISMGQRPPGSTRTYAPDKTGVLVLNCTPDLNEPLRKSLFLVSLPEIVPRINNGKSAAGFRKDFN